MGRLILLIAFIAAAVALNVYLAAQAPAFSRGFERLEPRLDEMIVIAAIGLAALQLDAKLRSVCLLLTLGAAVLAAYLTTRGLELPDTRLALLIAMVLVGAVGAGSGRLRPWLVPIAGLAALVVGHRATDPAPSADLIFLAGFGVAVAALLALGMALSDLSERVAGGFSAKIAAGVAGAGVYLLVDVFLV